MGQDNIKEIVREAYGKVARERTSCCGPRVDPFERARAVGYLDQQLTILPEGANMGLSCGNPTGMASLGKGEVVLDLGSGGGLDVFLAADEVGPTGTVIGVDMTPDMIENARKAADQAGLRNVEFRLGEIENLPVEDASIDVVISNCVINLSADKPRVLREIARVLKPGGRIAVSDMALLRELPEKIRASIDAYVGCVAGALHIDEYRRLVEEAGLKDVRVTIKGSSSCCASSDTVDPVGKAVMEKLGEGESLEGYVASVYVEGRK